MLLTDMKKLLTLSLLGFGLALATTPAALAQEPADGGPAPANTPTAIPLDGGASLLLAGGIGYAVRRLRQRKANR